MASIEPLLSESYWSTSPTPKLSGRPEAKTAVEPVMVRLFPAPESRAVVLPGPTDRKIGVPDSDATAKATKRPAEIAAMNVIVTVL